MNQMLGAMKDVGEGNDGRSVQLVEGVLLMDESLVDLTLEVDEQIDVGNDETRNDSVRESPNYSSDFEWEIGGSDEESPEMIDLTQDDESIVTVRMDGQMGAREDMMEEREGFSSDSSVSCEESPEIIDLTQDDESIVTVCTDGQMGVSEEMMEEWEGFSSDSSVSCNSGDTNDDTDEFVATGEDVVEIERMLQSGSGVFGHRNCKLSLEESLLHGAGLGVFLNFGETIHDGECITRYSGRSTTSTSSLSVEDQLRTIEVGSLAVVGARVLENGDGFASFMNSSVSGRTISFVRFVVYNGSVYAMACISKPQYPLVGYMELYLTAGHEWWSLYHSVYDN